MEDVGDVIVCTCSRSCQTERRHERKTCPAPLTGLSLVWLNSATGTLEKPARKSKLLTPVTLRVCRPLQLTFGGKSFFRMFFCCVMS